MTDPAEVPFRVEPDVAPGGGLLDYELPRQGRVRLTVRGGERRTGGYRVAVSRITRDGPTLTIQCEIHAPPPGALVTQVLTSPAQTVSVDAALVRGVGQVVLVDRGGAELARISA